MEFTGGMTLSFRLLAKLPRRKYKSDLENNCALLSVCYHLQLVTKLLARKPILK